MTVYNGQEQAPPGKTLAPSIFMHMFVHRSHCVNFAPSCLQASSNNQGSVMSSLAVGRILGSQARTLRINRRNLVLSLSFVSAASNVFSDGTGTKPPQFPACADAELVTSLTINKIQVDVPFSSQYSSARSWCRFNRSLGGGPRAAISSEKCTPSEKLPSAFLALNNVLPSKRSHAWDR